MFNSDNKKKLKQQDDVMIERNRIAHKTTFKGEIISEGDFRIDGSCRRRPIYNRKSNYRCRRKNIRKG